MLLVTELRLKASPIINQDSMAPNGMSCDGIKFIHQGTRHPGAVLSPEPPLKELISPFLQGPRNP
eukprot:5792461-Amphidinium_carterae.1